MWEGLSPPPPPLYKKKVSFFFTLFVPHFVALPFGSDFGGRWGDYRGGLWGGYRPPLRSPPHFVKKKVSFFLLCSSPASFAPHFVRLPTSFVPYFVRLPPFFLFCSPFYEINEAFNKVKT